MAAPSRTPEDAPRSIAELIAAGLCPAPRCAAPLKASGHCSKCGRHCDYPYGGHDTRDDYEGNWGDACTAACGWCGACTGHRPFRRD